MSNGPSWIECGEKVHGLYSELLSVGSSLMRVEDHLTLGKPGADVELEETKEKLTGLVKNIEELLVLLRRGMKARAWSKLFAHGGEMTHEEAKAWLTARGVFPA
jgi:hypothetical protein